eukprot:12807191-Alexandrium_andersonii.AAC.1
MSASLVGSEMCIRDRTCPTSLRSLPSHREHHLWSLRSWGHGARDEREATSGAKRTACKKRPNRLLAR